MRQILPGILFAMLWASAAAATKIGIQVTHPLLLANVRFFIAGVLMLCFAYIIQGAKNRLPRGWNGATCSSSPCLIPPFISVLM
ncbi:EamA family transporter [Chitinophaga horti]|uniref:EamA family transporter n=1 Tax=Chitinophaga horti TaxID=2920382 RepID=A0ABY6J0K0_9BACT|nr:EamA family transporter [Chitinophaga horti]UYQ93171.1 EamA family transporter [Chitinophaga horti]